MAKLKIGVFGGGRGMVAIRQLLHNPDAELVAVCDKYLPLLDEVKKAAEEAKAEEMRIARMNTKSVRADFQGEISHEALYGRSFVNGGYCGD